MDKIDFRYNAAHNTDSIAGMMIIASFVLMMVHLYIGLSLLIITVLVGNSSEIFFTHIKGSFIFDSDSFLFKKQRIYYHNIAGIVRESYSQRKLFGSQLTPNQFRIILNNSKDITLRVSSKEEQAFWRQMNKVTRKIYGGNSLGVSFSLGGKAIDEAEIAEKDARFEAEKPKTSYTLVVAIKALSEHSKVRLNNGGLDIDE